MVGIASAGNEETGFGRRPTRFGYPKINGPIIRCCRPNLLSNLAHRKAAPRPLASAANRKAENTFTLPGLGKLVLVNRKARMGRNPATGEAIQIKAKRVVKFRVAKAAKDAILGTK